MHVYDNDLRKWKAKQIEGTDCECTVPKEPKGHSFCIADNKAKWFES